MMQDTWHTIRWLVPLFSLVAVVATMTMPSPARAKALAADPCADHDSSYATTFVNVPYGGDIATTLNIHYRQIGGPAPGEVVCILGSVQAIGQGDIYHAGTLRADVFECWDGGCGNEQVGTPYGPPIPFHNGWYGATLLRGSMSHTQVQNGDPVDCVQADGMYQPQGSATQYFVWTPGGIGRCYPLTLAETE